MSRNDKSYIKDFLIWGFKDAEQQRDIKENSSRIHRARLKNLDEMEVLNEKVDALLLINQALLELLSEKLEIEDEDIFKKIEEVDLRDGRLDGKINSRNQPWSCGKCNHTNASKFFKCVVCKNPKIYGPKDS